MSKNHNAPSPSRREVQKQRLRQQIIDATERLLMAGDRQVAADKIAVEADVARRTVFNYFSTIEEIVVAVAIKQLMQFWDVIEDSEEAARAELHTLGDLLTMLEPTIVSEHMQQTLQTFAQWFDWTNSATYAAETIMESSVEALVDEFIDLQLSTRGLQIDFHAKLFSATLSRSLIVCADQDPSMQRWQELATEAITLLRNAFAEVAVHPQLQKDDTNG